VHWACSRLGMTLRLVQIWKRMNVRKLYAKSDKVICLGWFRPQISNQIFGLHVFTRTRVALDTFSYIGVGVR
jgi:hypothetical protein